MNLHQHHTTILPQVFQAALAGGVSNLSFGDLSSNLGATMYKYSFRVPPYYTLLVRSLSVLEVCCCCTEYMLLLCILVCNGVALCALVCFVVLPLGVHPSHDPQHPPAAKATHSLFIPKHPPTAQHPPAPPATCIRASQPHLPTQGIALSSEPGYKVLRAAYPWVARRLLTDQSPELRDTLLALLYKNGRFQFARCESLLREAIKSPARGVAGAAASGRAGVCCGAWVLVDCMHRQHTHGHMHAWAHMYMHMYIRTEIIISFLLSLSPCLTSTPQTNPTPAPHTPTPTTHTDASPPPSTTRTDALALLLSPEGSFIREIVVEELSKGLDAAWRVGADRAVGIATDSLSSLLQMREQLPLRGAVTEQVLRGVQQVPVLSDGEDVEQIEGLMRLARLLGVSAGVCVLCGVVWGC